MKLTLIPAAGAAMLAAATTAHATLVDLGACTGANACVIASDLSDIPDPVARNPNDGVLLAWDEVQNVTLTEDLRVDRVFDPDADFVGRAGDDFVLRAGTIVSSHYLQWDPGNGSARRVETTVSLDSQIFAFITADRNLFASDVLGLPGIDYNDFGLRGLEAGDTTIFDGPDVEIGWTASSPGDWTRLITAFSPGGAPDPTPDPVTPSPIPVPASLPLLAGALALAGAAFGRRRG